MTAAAKEVQGSILGVRQNLITLGYRIVPCKGKFPAGFSGWQHAHATHENALAWEATHPENTNTGILTGEVVAIDIDILRPDLAEAISAMVRELPGGELAPMRVGKPPKTMFLFRTNEPREKILTDWFAIDGTDQRIEVMGVGQQVIVDGVHPETHGPYAWITPLKPLADLPLIDWSSLEALLADASALLAQHADRRKAMPVSRRAANDNVSDNYFRRVNDAALGDLAAWVPALDLPKTRRQGAGYRAVCEWRGVKNANLSFHPEGITDWGSGETHTAIDVVHKSGVTDGPTSAAEWLCARLGTTKEKMGWVDKGAPMLPPSRLVEKLVLKAKPEQISTESPFTPAAAAGLMGDIAQWILDTSRRKSPELAVMAAVAFMSAFYGRRVVGPTGCGVNLYLAGIAGPGFGKEAPLQRLVKALQDSDMAFLVGAGEVSSSSAIEKILRRKPVVVMPWDEIGDVLEAINATGPGNWSATIRKAMLELYSKSTGVWFGKETTDEERMGEPIHCPSLTIIGTSTPTRFYGGLSEKNLADGFVARMIFVAPTKRPARANPRDNGLRLPPSLLAAIKDAQERFPWPKRISGAAGQWRVANATPALIEIPWANDEAERAWIAIEDWQESEIEKDESRDGIVGRLAENAIRLATLRALSRNPAKPSITSEDVEWARAIMMASIEAVDSGVDKFMSSSRFEELCRAILGALRKSGGVMYRAELLKRRGVRGAENRMFDEAVKRLQETGEIEQTDGRSLALTPAGWG
ncbi:bifunctional DNA primase/polymerase [Phyllobacteriaceae bacterium JZ32]